MFLKLFRQVLEEIRDRVDEERLVTEESIKRKLKEYQQRLEAGEISQEVYEEKEEWLINRLRRLREEKKVQEQLEDYQQQYKRGEISKEEYEQKEKEIEERLRNLQKQVEVE